MNKSIREKWDSGNMESNQGGNEGRSQGDSFGSARNSLEKV